MDSEQTAPARPRIAGRRDTAAGLALAFALSLAFTLAGCSYSTSTPTYVTEGSFQEGVRPTLTPGATATPAPALPAPTVGGKAVETPGTAAVAPTAPAAAAAGVEGAAQKAAILDSVIRQIQAAAINPGGNHFGNATKNLNQYFSGVPAADLALTPETRTLLRGALPADQVDALESPTFAMPDARHLEDCMMYQGIARRAAGQGDDLVRARRVFDWMVRQIQLVPPGALGSPQLQQAYARPFDVLLRGMATESEGVWSERGWLFLSLCRQLGLDAGLITYTPAAAKAPIIWCVAVLVDRPGPGGEAVPTPYLFDTRVGLPIPGPGGEGVATLADAMTDPEVLDDMDLPGQSPYGTTRKALVGSASKIGVLIDSGQRYASPRMKLLQQSLAGKNLTVLYRDPAEQKAHWAAALGDRFGGFGLWELPMTVERLLFTSPQFVESTQRSLILFRSEFPLLYARMKQLRGETADAVEDYVSMRLKTNALMTDEKTPMPPEIQAALNVYSTYFLGMCHLDRNDPEKAERFFERTLQMLAEPSKNQPFFNMYRWGAQANLARLNEAKGEVSKAIAYYAAKDPTAQHHGNLLRARDLVWRDPLAPCPDPLPPAPAPIPVEGPAAALDAPR